MIRNLKKVEIAVVSEMYEKIMSPHFIAVGEEPISAVEYQKRVARRFGKDSMCVLDDGRIKGFLWFFKEDDEINIEELFVTEDGKGYGKELMNFILELAKKEKIKKINLDVHFKNNHAMEFFRKFGFSERTIEFSLDLD